MSQLRIYMGNILYTIAHEAGSKEFKNRLNNYIDKILELERIQVKNLAEGEGSYKEILDRVMNKLSPSLEYIKNHPQIWSENKFEEKLEIICNNFLEYMDEKACGVKKLPNKQFLDCWEKLDSESKDAIRTLIKKDIL